MTVRSGTRPVPLDFAYSELPLAKTLESLLADGKGPVYVVHFTQKEAAESAQDFTSITVASRDEKAAVASAVESFKFASPYGPELKKWLRHGIGLHHAGLLPKYRILVEQLAQRGLLKVICGTDTLGVGINVPIRTVLFTRLCKYSGEKVAILNARDFHQISGRAGRKGYDDVGWVVAQAPEHVIENLKLEEKSRSTGKKVVKRQAPEHNFVNWDKNTYTRLMTAPPEPLTSRFQVTHAMLLNVLGRPGDGCRAMREMIRRCHDSAKQKKAHSKRAWQLFRSLVDRGIIEIVPPVPGTPASGTATLEGQASSLPVSTVFQPVGPASPDAACSTAGNAGWKPAPPGRLEACPPIRAKLRVNVALPEDFSLNQVLSLYLLDTVPLLDREAPDYALDLVTLVESILEDPDAILRAQLSRLKGDKIAELKAQGMEYDQRMEELEKLEHPKPKREFIYDTFNAWADKHPWVGKENIRPKSIAREMFEQFRSFADYIKIYDLQRAEGVLLRHLNSVYKVLAQTVPDAAKDDAVREMELYLGAMLRQVDSSLLDEWEKMRHPDRVAPVTDAPELRPPGSEAAAQDVTRDAKAFTASIRNKAFAFLRALADHDLEQALAVPSFPEDGEGQPWTADRLRKILEAYHSGHRFISLDPEARNLRHTYVLPAEDKLSWRVQQGLVDPDGHNDWIAEFGVDLVLSRAAKEPVLRLLRIGDLV